MKLIDLISLDVAYRFLWSIILIACVNSASQTLAETPATPSLSSEHRDYFEKEVRPLLVKRCLACHGGTKAAGGLSLASTKGWSKGGEGGSAIVPGKPDESLLIDAINYRNIEMPPPDEGGKLPDEEIAVLTKWVQMGAPEAPSHPELLDFLAARFVQSGYSVKALHRLILRSATYQRASGTPSISDPENVWLSHFSRRRLTAEELRDSLLTASRQLDLTPGEAHPFPEAKTWTFTQHGPFNAVYETNRRSTFLMVQRQRRHPYLALFDGADPNASTPTRHSTTVPTQALYFINDPFFHSQAAAIATDLMKQTDNSRRIPEAWHVLLQRQPTTAEVERAQTFLASYPDEAPKNWEAVIRVLLASNEYMYVD